MQEYKLRDCFKFYRTVPTNIRWSWSGRSLDGKTVSVTFWQDLFEGKERVYRSTSHKAQDKWYGSRGHKELIANLAHARDNCEGVLKIIVAIPIDPDASPREIKECFPAPNMEMRLVSLDPATGEFLAKCTTTPKIEGEFKPLRKKKSKAITHPKSVSAT